MSPWFVHWIRVRYQETDQMSVVYHANYLNWFEIGRTELIRHLGRDYRSVERDFGVMLPVVDLRMAFAKPALYDDIVGVHVRIRDLTGVRISFEYEVRRRTGADAESGNDGPAAAGSAGSGLPQDAFTETLSGELLVSGETRHVWIRQDWRPVRLDREAPEVYRMIRLFAERAPASSGRE